MSKLEEIQKEYNEMMEKLSSPEKFSNWDGFGEYKKILEEIISQKKIFDNLKKQIDENKKIIEEKTDKELIKIAEEELPRLKEQKEKITENLKKAIAEKETSEEDSGDIRGSVIMEIRAGAGGDEASLFTANLFEMYGRYAQIKNLDMKVLEENKTEQGGYKFIIFKVKNGNPYRLFRYEAGVHRVQRVPTTEKGGRVHTSTASVAVFPEPKKGKVKIKTEDLKIETCKSSGPGGQYVNKRETAVRIVHEPSGIVVTSQNERSLAQNKETALSILEARLLEKERVEKMEKLDKERKSQIGAAMRAEKIRTYNFLQNRVTDHRVEQSWYKLEEILGGDIDEIINTLREAEEREKYKDIVIE